MSPFLICLLLGCPVDEESKPSDSGETDSGETDSGETDPRTTTTESDSGETGDSDSGETGETGDSDSGETGDSDSGGGETGDTSDSDSGGGETGDTSDSDSGGGETGDSDSGGGETGDSDSGGGETADTSDSDSGGGETGDSDSGGGETGDSDSGGGETGDSDSGGGETGDTSDSDSGGGDTGPTSPDDDADGYTLADGDCDDADPTVHPGAEESWGDGVDQDCDGAADAASSSCAASLLLSFPDGSSMLLDQCELVELAPDYDYADDAPPEIVGLAVTLQSSSADCSLSFVQDGICGPGLYDQAGGATLTTVDCADAPAEWSGSYGADSGYLRLDTLDAGSAVGDQAGLPVLATVEGRLHLSLSGLDLDGDFALSAEQLAGAEVPGDGCLALEADADGDGAESTAYDGDDCDDSDPAVSPAATEVCDGVDNDCDGDADGGAVDATTSYADTDGDGWGDATTGLAECSLGEGRAWTAEDCDDADASVAPDAVEACDGVDNDCDGLVDTADTETGLYEDLDGDGYGSVPVTDACSPPANAVSLGGDCDDADPSVSPGVAEVCDDLDNDCDGTVDDGVLGSWYQDADGDGYGSATAVTTACDMPAGHVADNTDCDDSRNTSYPGAEEVCTSSTSSCSAEGRDNDCDGSVDDGCQIRSGTISADTTWEGDNLVCSDVTVSSAATLTVKDNAILKFRSGKKLTVNGTLDVQGTSVESGSYVSFTPELASASSGAWSSVTVSGGTATIQGAFFDRPQYAINASSGASVTMIASEVYSTSSHGIYQKGGSLSLVDVQFEGVGFKSILSYDSATVDASGLSVTDGGGLSFSDSTITLADSSLEDTTDTSYAVYFDACEADVSGLTVTNSAGDGLYAISDTVLTLTDTTITGAASDGLRCSNSSCVVSDLSVEAAGGAGVSVGYGPVELRDSMVSGSAGFGLEVEYNDPFVLTGTTITGGASAPVSLDYIELLAGIDTTNVLTGNADDRIYAGRGTIDTTQAWVDPGVPVLYDDALSDFIVNSGATLTLGPGFTVDLDGADILIGNGTTSLGGLVTEGTADAPVTIQNGELILDYLAGPTMLAGLTFTGETREGALEVRNRTSESVLLSDLTIDGFSGTYGIYGWPYGDLTIEGCVMKDSSLRQALYLQGDSIRVSGCTISDIDHSVNSYFAYVNPNVSATVEDLVIHSITSTDDQLRAGLYVSADSDVPITLRDVSIDGMRGSGLYLYGGSYSLDTISVTGSGEVSTDYTQMGAGLVLGHNATLASATGLSFTDNAGPPVAAYNWTSVAGLDYYGTYTGNGSDGIYVYAGTGLEGGLFLEAMEVPYYSDDDLRIDGMVYFYHIDLIVPGITIESSGASADYTTDPHFLQCDGCEIEARNSGSGTGIEVQASEYVELDFNGLEITGFETGVYVDRDGSNYPVVNLNAFLIHGNSDCGITCTGGCADYELDSGNSVLSGGSYYSNGTDICTP